MTDLQVIDAAIQCNDLSSYDRISKSVRVTLAVDMHRTFFRISAARTQFCEDAGCSSGIETQHLNGIGGRNDRNEEPWYVVGKNLDDNALIVAQGEHELLFSDWLVGTDVSWIGNAPQDLENGLRCTAKIRYRQSDQNCVVEQADDGRVKVRFEARQKAVAPGQYVVFYQADRCLGGAVIDEMG